jgi:hypothetical protein
MELGVKEMITIIIAIMVLFCISFLAMTVPVKANSLITTIDTWLSDHGLDLGLIPRATDFGAVALYETSSQSYWVKVSWKPTAKAVQENPIYTITDSYNANLDGSGTNIKAIKEGDQYYSSECTGTGEHNCACPSISTPCRLRPDINTELGKYGGQHQLTLTLYSNDAQKKELNSQLAYFKFYTPEYAQNLAADSAISSIIDSPFSTTVGNTGQYPKVNFDLNGVKCSFGWIWAAQYYDTCVPIGGQSCPDMNAQPCKDANTILDKYIINLWGFTKITNNGYIDYSKAVSASHTLPCATNQGTFACVINYGTHSYSGSTIYDANFPDKQYYSDCCAPQITATQINYVYNRAGAYLMYLTDMCRLGATGAQAKDYAKNHYGMCVKSATDVLNSLGWKPYCYGNTCQPTYWSDQAENQINTCTPSTC